MDQDRSGESADERAPYDPMPHGPEEVGVGPWVGPWPEAEQYDARLLAEGDRRNVVDRDTGARQAVEAEGLEYRYAVGISDLDV